MENTTKLTEQQFQEYYEFISFIYTNDVDNREEYKKVEGLMEAMRKIYKQSSPSDIFLMKCIVKEINKITRKRKKLLVEQN